MITRALRLAAHRRGPLSAAALTPAARRLHSQRGPVLAQLRPDAVLSAMLSRQFSVTSPGHLPRRSDKQGLPGPARLHLTHASGPLVQLMDHGLRMNETSRASLNMDITDILSHKVGPPLSPERVKHVQSAIYQHGPDIWAVCEIQCIDQYEGHTVFTRGRGDNRLLRLLTPDQIAQWHQGKATLMARVWVCKHIEAAVQRVQLMSHPDLAGTLFGSPHALHWYGPVKHRWFKISKAGVKQLDDEDDDDGGFSNSDRGPPGSGGGPPFPPRGGGATNPPFMPARLPLFPPGATLPTRPEVTLL